MSNLQSPPSSSRPYLRPVKIGITGFLLGPACLIVIEPINELIKLFKGYSDNYYGIIFVFVSVLYGLGIIVALGLGISEFLKSHHAPDPKMARSNAIIGIMLTSFGFFCSPIALFILGSIVPCFLGC